MVVEKSQHLLKVLLTFKENMGLKFSILDIGGGFPGVKKKDNLFKEVRYSINYILHSTDHELFYTRLAQYILSLHNQLSQKRSLTVSLKVE